MLARLMGLQTVQPRDLLARVQAGQVATFDVNSPQSFGRAHVPGAINLDASAFTQADLPADRDAPVVFYCSNFMCRKAPNAALRARRMGYTHVHVMSAGISGWLAAGLPTQPQTPA